MISTIFIIILMVLISGPCLYCAFCFLRAKDYSLMVYFLLPALFVLAVGFKLIGI